MNAYMHITLPLVVHTINPWFPNLLTERKHKKKPKGLFCKNDTFNHHLLNNILHYVSVIPSVRIAPAIALLPQGDSPPT